MVDPELAPLAGWESFYVIVGSSGAALIGLQFVVMALIADIRVRSSHATIGAFGTPTIIHFGTALLVSTIMSAPWQHLAAVAWALRVVGLAGVLYAAVTAVRATGQEGYKMVWEDWLFHIVLPFAAYAALFVATITLGSHEGDSLFVIAGTALLLLFIAIHNAWDTVTYLVIDMGRQQVTKE